MTSQDIKRVTEITAAADAAKVRYDSIAAAIGHQDAGQLSEALWEGYRYNMDGDRLVWAESLMRDSLLDADLLHKAAELKVHDNRTIRLEIDVARAQQRALWKERGTQQNVDRSHLAGTTINDRQRNDLVTLIGEGRISIERLAGVRDLGNAIDERMVLRSKELRSEIDISKEAIKLADGRRHAQEQTALHQKRDTEPAYDRHQTHGEAMASKDREQDGVAIERLDGGGKVFVHDRKEARILQVIGTIGPLTKEENLAVQTAEAIRNVAASGYMTDEDRAIIRAEHERKEQPPLSERQRAIISAANLRAQQAQAQEITHDDPTPPL